MENCHQFTTHRAIACRPSNFPETEFRDSTHSPRPMRKDPTREEELMGKRNYSPQYQVDLVERNNIKWPCFFPWSGASSGEKEHTEEREAPCHTNCTGANWCVPPRCVLPSQLMSDPSPFFFLWIGSPFFASDFGGVCGQVCQGRQSALEIYLSSKWIDNGEGRRGD